ncbi:NUDIX hydrolase [Kordiimonas sediminis]|uniref:NUDIX hydrolase n=1 Tax=Kordiimonas sediminis TaxID=1735581 RepID=A0A919E9X2_9PROT|nr:NUDIX domain-containing protein [Kordiimonas sediminis]GHF28551.1 NUDIX hydrolase [Kordiimonas sediminis]
MTDQKKIAPALPSATILMVRDGAPGLEVLMLRRPETMRFAPGALVFPGGKVDDADCDPDFWFAHSNTQELPEDYMYRIAAHREMFEEVGLWHLEEADNPTEKLHGDFKEIVNDHNWSLDIDDMFPFAHWVTPEPLPMRFDTLFYLCPLKGKQKPYHEGDEAMELQWINPQQTLADWENDQVPLMFPTRLTLIKLARAHSVEEAVELARTSDVVKTMPTLNVVNGERTVTVPIEAGYGVTTATQRELRVEGPARKKSD